jgi:hypothetical protein
MRSSYAIERLWRIGKNNVILASWDHSIHTLVIIVVVVSFVLHSISSAHGHCTFSRQSLHYPPTRTSLCPGVGQGLTLLIEERRGIKKFTKFAHHVSRKHTEDISLMLGKFYK